MRWKRIVAAVLLVLTGWAVLAFRAPEAYAQDSVINRKGIAGLLEGKKKSGPGPTAWQMGLGIGSIFVMIAVVKWL